MSGNASDKMWAGRFAAETDGRVNDFNSSIRFDCRMYEEDITGSIVHARMLARQGIISAQDREKIEGGLLEIMGDIKSGKLAFDPAGQLGRGNLFDESLLEGGA